MKKAKVKSYKEVSTTTHFSQHTEFWQKANKTPCYSPFNLNGNQLIGSSFSHPLLQINGRQFPAEAYYQRHIRHPNIIQLLDIFTHDDKFVFVLERPEDSTDLFDFIDAGDGMTEYEGRRFFAQILEATIKCEEQGVMHRDLKPENIIVDLKNQVVKLTDFGLACETQEDPFRRFVGKRSGADVFTDRLERLIGYDSFAVRWAL